MAKAPEHSSRLILPDRIDAETQRAAASGATIDATKLVAASAGQEAALLEASVHAALPLAGGYHPDAPLCDTAWYLHSLPTQTQHHAVVALPAWAHGRCIGPACVRFVAALSVCGRLVQDYAAAVAVGVMTAAEAKEAVRAAALPPPEREERC